jgi:hypothetical protein
METRTMTGSTYEAGAVPFDFFKRVSWGAIFAGSLVAIVVDIMLSLLGLGIGLGIISPATEDNPLGLIGIGAGIWMALSALIALFAGAWVAGRLAGIPRRSIGAIHGIVVWGVATLFAFFVMTTAVGSLVSGISGAVGRSLSAVTSQVQTGDGISLDAIVSQARALTGTGEDKELGDVIRKVFSGTTPNQADRAVLVDQLVEKGGMSRAEASSTVDTWIQRFSGAREGVAATAEQAMSALSKAAIWSFIAMLLGAIAAALGGIAGSPKENLPIVPLKQETLKS